MRFGIFKLFKIKTLATLVTMFSLIFVASGNACGQNKCLSHFESSKDVEKIQIPTIKMSTQYIGENRGLYFDPITKQKWHVVYYSDSEKKTFEVTYKNKFFWTSQGQKANSFFDSEALSFNHSLIVIDKDFRIFTLPFEERGKYHHSSLTSGQDILFAGTVAFSDGHLRELSDLSGHYKPTPEQTLLILKELRHRGVDLKNLKLSGRIAIDLGHTPMLTPREVEELLNQP